MSHLSLEVGDGVKELQPADVALPATKAPGAQRPSTDYLFVSNVRFASMVAVVAIHCLVVSAPLVGISSSGRLMRILTQPFRLGSIGFFLISGFLMGEGLVRRGPLGYLERRLRTICGPWLFWYLISCVLSFSVNAAFEGINVDSGRSAVRLVFYTMYGGMFNSAYWFVPNLLLALCVLLLCRHYLSDLRLGLVLLTASLLYGVNIYTRWFATVSHTQALFGFIFYLWLGAWAARNYAVIVAWMERVPLTAFIALAVLTFIAAVGEAELITAMRLKGAMNSLRISNQIFALALALTIFKLPKAIWPRSMNVRKNTFGIYLTHWVFLVLLLNALKMTGLKIAAGTSWGARSAIVTGILLGDFVLVYGCSFATAKFLLRFPRLRWMVGAFPPDRVAAPAEPVSETNSTAAFGTALMRSSDPGVPVQD